MTCLGAIPEEFEDDLGKVVGHITEKGFDEKVKGISKYIKEWL